MSTEPGQRGAPGAPAKLANSSGAVSQNDPSLLRTSARDDENELNVTNTRRRLDQIQRAPTGRGNALLWSGFGAAPSKQPRLRSLRPVTNSRRRKRGKVEKKKEEGEEKAAYF